MADTFQTTAIIRERGQLTIKNELRDKLPWLTPNSVVTITVQLPNAMVIKPYQEKRQTADWKKIWDSINLARSFMGKRGNLSEYIIQDRMTH